jgi:hypothetical protein
MKYKTLKDNVTNTNQPKGSVIELPEDKAQHYLKVGAIEKLEEPKKQAPKKAPAKKKTEESE